MGYKGFKCNSVGRGVSLVGDDGTELTMNDVLFADDTDLAAESQ